MTQPLKQEDLVSGSPPSTSSLTNSEASASMKILPRTPIISTILATEIHSLSKTTKIVKEDRTLKVICLACLNYHVDKSGKSTNYLGYCTFFLDQDLSKLVKGAVFV